MLLAFVVACGSTSSSHTANNGGASTGGGAGMSLVVGETSGAPNAGGTHGAVAGSAGVTSNLGGTGGASGGGASGSSSASGGSAGAAITAFDPKVAIPTHDCRTDTTHKNCISLAGTFDGKPFDTFCNAPDDLSSIIYAGAWELGCEHKKSPADGYQVLYVTVRRPSELVEAFMPANNPNFRLIYIPAGMTQSTMGVSSGDPNRVSAQLESNIAPVSSTYRLVTGTLHSSWSAPDSKCLSYFSAGCASADINVTFRLETDYGNCLDDSDCVAPKTCDKVAYTCFEN